MFTFGDLVTATCRDGRTVDGIIISTDVDNDGDWKVAYAREGDTNSGDYDYFATNRLVKRNVPVSVPDIDMLRGGKITAIKALRAVTQWGLKDAKDVVDAIMELSETSTMSLRNELNTAQDRANDLERKLRDLYAALDKDVLIDLLMK